MRLCDEVDSEAECIVAVSSLRPSTMAESILMGAHDIEIHDSQFIDNSQTSSQAIQSQTVISQTINSTGPVNTTQNINSGRISGIERLLNQSIPEALHDSSARDPPPKCHPGTRCEYIDKITTWGTNSDGRKHRLIWIYGPAGVGKSAVSQSCADVIAEQGKLGAAFFFSMPNKRDKPNFFFTTIAYQLAMKDESCRQIIDTIVSKDPTLVAKAIKQQFQHLIVAPLAELKARGEDVGELVIIIDGLDECANDGAQSEIIEIVAESIRKQTTPFLWVIVSRPEAHIQAKFTSPEISPLSLHIELPVSRSIDLEITKFLTDELKGIQVDHCLPETWPLERQIGTLVNLSAGLFIYATTVIRFIKDKNSSGPDDQLRAVVALAEQSTKESESHPLSELDSFYMLIMQRVPQKVLPMAQKILLVTTFEHGTDAAISANLLGLTEAQFRNACRSLHSVLEMRGDDEPEIKFYHASFIQFLLDPKRSRNFCIKSDCATILAEELLAKLGMAIINSSPPKIDATSFTWPGVSMSDMYLLTFKTFLQCCQLSPHPPSKLDLYYTLAMQHIPQEMVLIFQKILLVRMFVHERSTNARANAHGGIANVRANVHPDLLGLTKAQFLDACRFFKSVLKLHDFVIEFHDSSFMGFLLDPRRSRNFCIESYHEAAAAVRRALLDKLNVVNAGSRPGIAIDPPFTWAGSVTLHFYSYAFVLKAFFRLCESFPLDHEMLIALSTFGYEKIPVIMADRHFAKDDLAADKLLQNIPRGFRGIIIRRYPVVLFHLGLLTKPDDADCSRPYVLGNGKNSVLLWRTLDGGWWFRPYLSTGMGLTAKLSLV